MPFYADLHVHSKHSRATSKDLDLEHLSLWARKKGISVVATGDFTHPAWLAELKAKLVPAEPGLFRLRPEVEREVAGWLPGGGVEKAPRFLLSVEISTIYKKGDRTRKIHHLIYVPDFPAADRLVARLSKIGNLAADGRPILGLDSRDLLEMVLESSPHAYLVPAHAWTPWFAVLGSRSGFDSIEECYGDLAREIFAVETGLSSDPPMNWRVSALDRYRLVSNSDAHSPAKLGREACLFDTGMDYFAIRQALETGEGYVGTVEFFPEEGKYHLDGHRRCGVRLSPEETRRHGGRCPACGEAVTLGVQHRVEELADRSEPVTPETAGEVRNLIPLPEILSEIEGTGVQSRRVQESYEGLLTRLGPEIFILERAPLEEVSRQGSPLLAEAIARLRRGEVICQAGFDGEYGVIRLFRDGELERLVSGGLLFHFSELPGPVAASRAPAPAEAEAVAEGGPEVAPGEARSSSPPVTEETAAEGDVLAGLDPEQRGAATVTEGPLLIVAGPGSGKTRTLTHRIAHLIVQGLARPEECLAITFTRRAAQELRERLEVLLPEAGRRVPVHTFHSLALAILREHAPAAGLPPDFRIADEGERTALLQKALGVAPREARRLLHRISRAQRTEEPQDEALAPALGAYRQALAEGNLLDFDDLVARVVDLLESHPEIAAGLRARYPHLSIDEYQDIDPQQYRLIRLLAPAAGSLCAIGDPDQAIYGFRGADVRLFHRFTEDFPGARVAELRRNYRSSPVIVRASAQVVGAEEALGTPGAPESAGTSEGESSGAAESAGTLGVGGPRIVLHHAPSDRAEAEFVVHTIEEKIGGHSFFSLDSGRATGAPGTDLSFADFAILYRTDAQSEPLLEALSRSGIPYQKRTHTPLADHPGVPLLLAGLGDSDPAGPLLEALRSTAGRLVSEAPDPETRRSLEEALDLLIPLARACGDDLHRFRQELTLSLQVDTWDPRADRVSLLTLHAAKGLEFRVVFIVGCEDGILPLRWGEDPDPEDLDEERRLFYVGMTRARDRLFLSQARRRAWRGQVREMGPSPFLQAIEEELLQRQEREKRTPGHRQLKLF